ncbi:MAG TPA: ABC transporter ATP-binding protein [Erysipelothrix sp.]|nr:ABC transporter ATP-binding protein [Erysipelothrix sp.]
MLKYLKNKKMVVLLSLTFALIGNLAMVVTPFYLGQAIDHMIGKNNVAYTLVGHYLKTALLLYLISFVFVWLSNYISFVVSSTITEEIRHEIQTKLAHLPLSYLDTHAHGTLANMISNDSDLILDGYFQLLSQILGGVVVILAASVLMFRINGFMTLIVFATIPFVYLSSHLVSKSSIDAFSKQTHVSGALNGFVHEAIYNHDLVLNMNYQDTVEAKFEVLNKDYNKIGQKAQFVSSLTNPTTRVVNNISYALLGLSGAVAILSNSLTVGLFTSFLSYSMMFSKPFNELSANLSTVFQGKASMDKVAELLSEEEIIDKGTKDISSNGHVVFDDVDFSYNKSKPLITSLNLDIKPKQKIAIVGPTGAGKSTLINILMRYYEVDGGEVLIDGVDIRHLSRESLHDNLSIVLQDPWLFEGTVLENVRYGKPDASLEDVIEACKQADCHDMIERFDKGYDTMISQGATNISQGQMQLLTIARALLFGGSILILDEATSNIDSLTEKKIQNVFTEIMKEHTSFFVAHRLSTVVDSDVILVMKDGAIIEQGTHKALLNLNGFYKKLYESQYG